MSISKAGFISFIRTRVGISTQYLPDDSDDITTAYNLAKDQVNLFFASTFSSIYELMLYNLGAHILIEIAQDYFVLNSSITWSANVATVTTATANTFQSGNLVVISGAYPNGYNTVSVNQNASNVSSIAKVIATPITVTDSTHFTYSLTTNPGSAAIIAGQSGFNLFENLRAQWKINSFISGVIQESHDESTGETLAVPNALKNISLNELQLLKTPYGRFYLQYAAKFGSLWGIS